MPDLSMCLTDDCPSRQRCYRYTAVPDPHWQAYAVFVVPHRSKKCDSFMPLRRSRSVNKEKK